MERIDWKYGKWGTSSDARITFTGDWAAYKWFDELIIQTPEAIYGDTLNVLKKADLRVVNLECALGGTTPIIKSGPNISGSRKHLPCLLASGVDVATLGNNHFCDYGPEGIAETLNILRENNIRFCGAGMDRTEAEMPAICELNGVKAGIVSFTESGSDLPEAGENSPGIIGWQKEQLSRIIKDTRQKCDVVIAVMHAGCEYIPYPPAYVQEMARELIRAGANAVIAHHPHVPQGIEIYNDSPIVYSVGNYIFPNAGYFFNTRGYLLTLDIGKNGVTGFTIDPYSIGTADQGVSLLCGETKDEFLALLKELSAPFVRGEGETAWHGVLARRYQNKYHEKMWNNDLKHFAEDPAKAAAIIRNRTSKSCHVNFWRDYFHRLAEGFIADAPEWALKLCRLYEEKI